MTAAAVAKAQAAVNPNDPAATAAGLALLGPAIVELYGSAAATLAADFYDDQRHLAQLPTRFVATPVVEVRTEYLVGNLAGWATQPLRVSEADVQTTYDRIAQVIQKETAAAYRQTITRSVAGDESAVGWQRITGHTKSYPDGCPFCDMLAGRGDVYSRGTVRFAAHDTCACSAAPVFHHGVGDPVNVHQRLANAVSDMTDQQRIALKWYLHDNYGGPLPQEPRP